LSVSYEHQYRGLHGSALQLLQICQEILCFSGNCDDQSNTDGGSGNQESSNQCGRTPQFRQLKLGNTGDIIFIYEIPGAPSHREYYQVEVAIEID